jgi:hypothetical protein
MRVLSLPPLVLLMTTSITAAKDWRGLKPLISTRADVERLLGAPQKPTRSSYESYKSGNDLIHVRYSTGICEDLSEWRVPRDTVTSIRVEPPYARLTADLLFRDLQMDPQTFKQSYLGDDGTRSYWNADEGILMVVIGGKDLLIDVTYTPTKKDEYLRCPGYPKPFLPTCASYMHVSIDGPTDSVIAGSPITLRARVEGGPIDIWPPMCRWTTSASKITNRGACSITIDTTGLDGQYVTVNLDVGELPKACPTAAAYKVSVIAPPKPVKLKDKEPSQ